MNYYWLSASNDKVSTFFVDFIDFKADLCGGIICDETIMWASVEE